MAYRTASLAELANTEASKDRMKVVFFLVLKRLAQ